MNIVRLSPQVVRLKDIYMRTVVIVGDGFCCCLENV